MQHDEIISGTIERFLFQNSENGFVVFVLTNAQLSTVVKGYLPTVQVGHEVTLTGNWIIDKKFGKQFHAQKCTCSLPTTLVGLKKYLSSGLIKGIGTTYAEKLVNYFKEEILTVIDLEPHRLQEVEGIGEKRAITIAHAWKGQKEVATIMVFLQERDISTAYAAKIYKQYGQESIAVLHENPYRIADEIWGIGFKIADSIAQKLGFARNCPQRIIAGILFTLSSATSQGHLYLELENLKTQTLTILELDPEEKILLKNALHNLYSKEKIKLICKDQINYIGLTMHYFSEYNFAKKLTLIAQHSSALSCNIDAIYHAMRQVNNHEIELNETQQKAVLLALSNKVSIITGGPGTGKTTIIKKILTILDKEKASYKLAAPTGRAAKRIMESTGRYASTIHRILEFNVSTMSFTYNEQNALKLDYLILDESSMIDIFLAHALIKALPLQAHIIFIGDINQLPSVGPGNILHDLISSTIIPYIQLTEIFRQAADSLIITNAHKINNGEFPITSGQSHKKDFIFIKESDPHNSINHIKKILFIELKKFGLKPHDAQILVPMNRGVVGCYNLNHELQNFLNPHPKNSIQRNGITYKEGDKVMQIRNNYDKNSFNGDLGTITTIASEDGIIMVQFGANIVEYSADELNELVLAYATTIHKSQGSEYSAIIIPIFMQHYTLLQRNLLYTAVTRAKKLCVLLGEPKAIGMAIKNNKTVKRITFLADFMQEQITKNHRGIHEL